MVKTICLKCEKELENIGGSAAVQPMDGLAFGSRGHYGTAVFDPMNGDAIEIVVCDQCLVDAITKGQVTLTPYKGKPEVHVDVPNGPVEVRYKENKENSK